MTMNPLALEKVLAYTLPASSGGSSTAAPTNSTSTAYENARLAKTSAGILTGLTGYNSRSSSQFIQVHDSAAAAAEGVAPVIVIQVNATSDFSLDFGDIGRSFANGIYVCNSSTGPTKTIGSADCWFDVQFF